MKEFNPDIMYLSTTDYIQHKYEPGHKTANKFYSMFDRYIGQLDDLGAMIDYNSRSWYEVKINKKTDLLMLYFLQDYLDAYFFTRKDKSNFTNYRSICCSSWGFRFIRNYIFKR